MSSRIWIGNLPKHLTEQRLRSHFEQKGVVTDAKIVRTKEGQSRQFGYVGFKTIKDAKEALRYFNDTYIDTSKISIKIAKPFGDQTLDRPWSKYSNGSSAFTKRTPDNSATETTQAQKKVKRTHNESAPSLLPDSVKESTEFQQFMAAAKSRSSTKVWANDAETNKKTKKEGKTGKKESREKDDATQQEVSGVGKVIESSVASKKRGGEGVVHKRTHVIFDDDEDEKPEKDSTKPFEDSNDSDDEYQDFFASKEDNKIDDDSDEDDGDDGGDDGDDGGDDDGDDGDDGYEKDDNSKPEKGDEEGETTDDRKKVEPEGEKEINGGTPAKFEKHIKEELDINSVAETGRLFVRNLPFSLTEEELKKLFLRFGEIVEIHLPIDKQTKLSKGVAFVRFSIPENAVRALNELDGTIYQGRLLHILPAKLNPRETSSTFGTTNSFKQQKEQERRQQSMNEKDSWNSLFLRSDTVASAMAEQYGVTKGDILGDERKEREDSMAVRLALGETKVIADTKKMFEEEGVDLKVLASFQSNTTKNRSNTTIIIKNLPFNTTKEELKKLFTKYGEIGRIVLAPSRAIAILEFMEPNDAKAAFRSLAYTKFKHLPLYLEWAPENVFSRARDVKNTIGGEDEAEEIKTNNIETTEVEGDETMTTLFVKNLSFETTEESLGNLFSKFAPRSVVIAKRKYSSQKDSPIAAPSSLGYGFLEFSNKQTAVNAMKSLQGAILDGHSVELKFSRRSEDDTAKRRSKQTKAMPPTSKLLVKNLPFQASLTELKDLFGTFGQLKKLRIPKKFDGSSRGFAFVEYLTKQDAQNALQSLHNTHLYGRHLVLEFAADTQEGVAEKAKSYYETLS